MEPGDYPLYYMKKEQNDKGDSVTLNEITYKYNKLLNLAIHHIQRL